MLDREQVSSRVRPASRLAAATLAMLAVLLAGCASLQDTQRPAPPAPAVPADWSGPADTPTTTTTDRAATDLARWWERFGDPTLSRLVERALQANRSLVQAEASWRQARALRDQAAAALSPNVSAGGSGQASKREGQASSHSVGASVDAGWELDLWGANRQAVTAAEEDLAAQTATLADARVSLAAEVASAYLDLRGSQAELAVARSSLDSQAHTAQLTAWRVEAGLVSPLDATQARSAVAQTRAQIPPLETAVAQSVHALSVLTGQPPTTLQGLLADAAPVPQPAGDLALAIPAEVLRQRPDVQAAEARLRAAAARVSAADLQRLPSLNLSGSIGLSAATFGGLGSGAGVAALAAAIDLPLFDGGRLQAQVQAQEAVFDAARAGYHAAVLGALREVEDALQTLDGTRRRRDSLAEALSAAQATADGARARYASGLVDVLTLLSAERSLLSVQDSVATNDVALAAAHVSLYKALGGGWDPEYPTASARR